MLYPSQTTMSNVTNKSIIGLALFSLYTLLSTGYSSSIIYVTAYSINNITYEEEAFIHHRNLSSDAIALNVVDENRLLPNSFLDNTKKGIIVESMDTKKLAESILLTKNASNSIYHFMEEYLWRIKHDLLILCWDNNGILDEYSLRHDRRFWWKAEKEYDGTKPSEYGTVAILLVTDVLHHIPWSIQPPVPILAFTIPKLLYDPYYRIIPTPYDRRGYKWLEQLPNDMANISFYDRKNVIVWRGTYHGADANRKILHDMSLEDKNNEWLDAAITKFKRIPDPAVSKISIEDMARNYKYQLDIGGVSGTSWGGLRWKMCTGNIVLKVDSWARDWWHDQIIPYEHYIPVKEDLSDLRQIYDWAESHPNEVDTIRFNGMKKCKETIEHDAIYDFEMNVMQQLQPSSKEIVEEVQLIRDGLLKFIK